MIIISMLENGFQNVSIENEVCKAPLVYEVPCKLRFQVEGKTLKKSILVVMVL